jgi:hypothetical protein
MKAELASPVLTFTPASGPYEGEEYIECIDDADWFFTLHPKEGRGENRIGMTVVGGDGRCWKVLGVNAGDIAWLGPWPIKVLRSLVGLNRRHADYEVLELDPMSLDQIKDRVVDNFTRSPDFWRDDEAIAGEAGEPRDEQEMTDERIAAVRRASSMKEIIDILDA